LKKVAGVSAFFVSVAAAVPVVPVALAHPVPFSYLDLRVGTDAIDGTLVVHIFDIAHELNVNPAERLLEPAYLAERTPEIIALLSRRLAVTADGQVLEGNWSPSIDPLPDREDFRLKVRYPIDEAPGLVSVSSDLFPYDPNHRTFLNVYEGESLVQAILEQGRPRFDYFAGTRQGVLAVVTAFIPAGIHHILIGPDHLLFLVGLLLLGGSIGRLALVVTGFTVAHSITLTLAALNVLMPPASLIEPAIALSIVCVGADNLLVVSRPGSRDLRAWMAFGFGFIHGFGFANVLREMDLPGRALGWSLFSFNLGVELGQLAFVVPVAAAMGWLWARNEAAARRVARIGSIVVVGAGVFWFAQRVFI
jgi:hydrogenase/urease accessory protein HupE